MNKVKKQPFKKSAIHAVFSKITAKLYKCIYIPINDEQTKKAAFHLL